MTLRIRDWHDICNSCARLVRIPNPDHDGKNTETISIATCRAFPDGIPRDIIRHEFDHRNPYPGDRGIRYELAPGLEKRLAIYESEVPEEKRTWDVRESARKHAVATQELWVRRLPMLEKVIDSEVRVPVVEDGEPLIWSFSDGLSWLDVSTLPSNTRTWSGATSETSRWDPVELASIVERKREAREFILYIDGETPVLPVRNLREADLGLLRAVRQASGSGGTSHLLNVFRDSTVYVPAEAGPGTSGRIEVFSSALALGARFGHVEWRAVPGAEILEALPAGIELILDEGRPHATRLV
jgi:hypothetical protein